MSYILDALKRADAERERGHVPGLHSQSTATPTSAPADPRRLRPGAALIAGVATLLLLVAAVWWWLAAPEPNMPPPATTLAPAAVPLPAAAPAPASEPVPAAPPAMQAGPALPILSPEPVPAAAPSSARLPAPTRASTTTPTTANPAEPAAPANVANNGNVRSFAELAPEIRAQLPQVSISGSTYSSNPAHRMLIANGKVVHEGEEIAPSLQLESIGPGKAVLNHRGTRYSIGY